MSLSTASTYLVMQNNAFMANTYHWKQRKTHLIRQVKCPIFLPNFNQISIFLMDLHGSPQYQISRKLVKTDDGHGEANKRLSGYENGSKNVNSSQSRQ